MVKCNYLTFFTLRDEDMAIKVFLTYNDHKAAAVALNLVAERFHGQCLMTEPDIIIGRTRTIFSFPGSDDIDSAAGKFCRRACEFLQNLKLYPLYGLEL
jgi:hypothetical protein